jgi:hypothetical protein
MIAKCILILGVALVRSFECLEPWLIRQISTKFSPQDIIKKFLKRRCLKCPHIIQKFLKRKCLKCPHIIQKFLKHRCLKCPHIIHLDLIGVSYDQKKRVKVKFSI